jgi:hypothetical protein
MNHGRRTLLVCAIASTALMSRLDAQKRSGADLTGTWQIQFQDDNGVSTSNPKLVIQQTGDKLTGTFGKLDWPIIGVVDRNHVVFTFTAHGSEGGHAISDTVFYWGTVDESGKMKGRMKNPKEAGEWVAAKK